MTGSLDIFHDFDRSRSFCASTNILVPENRRNNQIHPIFSSVREKAAVSIP